MWITFYLNPPASTDTGKAGLVSQPEENGGAVVFSPSAGACELSQKLLNERWTPYLQLHPAVVMLRGGIRLLGGLWSTFSTGSQRVPAPLANTSQRGKQARGGGRQAGSLIVCRSVDRTSLKMSGGLSVLSNSRAVSLGITEVCIS